MDGPVANAHTEPAPYDPGPRWAVRYWAIFIGQALSLVGSALAQFVLIWWITDTTGDLGALATAGMAALLPYALLSPLGGTFADRYDRRLLMIGADVTSALCVVVLVVLFSTGGIALWHIYLAMAVRSAMQAFQTPAAAASTAMLVPAEFLPRAAGLNQTLNGIVTIAAAPLGALAISVLPLGYAVGIDVVTALLGIVPLLLFRIPQVLGPQHGKSALWTEFREGVALVWDHPGLRRLYLLMAAVVLAIMPSFTLVPLLVKVHFRGGPPEVALLEGIAGLGMIIGGVIITAIAPRQRIPWVLWGFALSCLTLALTALMPSRSFPLAVAWWTLSGICFILGNAPLTALLQTTIPNQLQGRALALLGMVMGLAAPVGLALASPIGEAIGIRWLFVGMGLLGTLVSLVGFGSKALLSTDRDTPA